MPSNTSLNRNYKIKISNSQFCSSKYFEITFNSIPTFSQSNAVQTLNCIVKLKRIFFNSADECWLSVGQYDFRSALAHQRLNVRMVEKTLSASKIVQTLIKVALPFSNNFRITAWCVSRMVSRLALQLDRRFYWSLIRSWVFLTYVELHTLKGAVSSC